MPPQVTQEVVKLKNHSSSIHFNVLEGHSSVQGVSVADGYIANEEECEDETSEIAYENIEQLIDVDEDSSSLIH